MESMERDQSPCGENVPVSMPNQLTPAICTGLPAESTIWLPEVVNQPGASGNTGTAMVAAAPADGYQAYEVKHRYVKKKYRYYRYPYWADKLPVGTSAWWQQMDREQRGGRR